MDVGNWETAMVIVGGDGAEINVKSNRLATYQKQIIMSHVVSPIVTVGGPTARLGSCLDRARTVIL